MGVVSRPEAPISPAAYAVAGAAGAVLANAIVYPLDLVKTRLQVQEKETGGDIESQDETMFYDSTSDALLQILVRDGVMGLYRGIAGNLIGVASTNFAYFYWYRTVRLAYLKRSSSTSLSTAAELCLGTVAGALAQVFTIPVSVVTTRQQTQSSGKGQSLYNTAIGVIDDDGITGLWRGLKASLVLCVNPAITYGSYQRTFDPLIVLTQVLGALSKSLATMFTQPLIVAKVGLQSKRPSGKKPFRSFVDVMRYIIHTEGPQGLFKGIAPQISKGVLVQGLLMMIKERMELLTILLIRFLRNKNATVM